ncbi:type II toxin-antitoxin system RelE/ParE family toxin [Gracilinema caldarium]|uniref:Plasmid stabilization system n=1 Tax=Gracilinema caldarium (strain ATCC 51460 / DSM 7334 / H1) TaxID=744872 RepID=F8F300_GRAC1|nr:type II toxin-antitoxin system RelE/ParE family toxin [Gracilinema caldarium]AEJ19888.1 plasmid stabilization system [Gracilinema caldarium DSM 7334]AEJ19897.1 plasmid stabilization system [Gracilinema caldarium DSM 7334]AEJ19908.1 plasmid stabilization system [Gracilinema caldarium DSM 7334]AEJ19930.1 plasmid stabilization system [Gracilinema caldarium DSM 7334]
MNRDIVWSLDASDEFVEIILYITEHSGNNVARTIYEKIIKKIENLVDFPAIGRKVPELESVGNTEYYEIIESPWRIIYRYTENEVYIVSIIDGRRNIEEILYKKIIKGKIW